MRRRDGSCRRWLAKSDVHVREVSATVCGPLLAKLAVETQFHDSECVDLFRTGAAVRLAKFRCLCHMSLTGAELFGDMQGGNRGPQDGVAQGMDVPFLSWSRVQCEESNRELLASLREDANAVALHAVTLEDAALGWMSDPVAIDAVDLGSVRLVPRFGVEQGLKEDGSVKIRPVDHMSWSAGGSLKRRRTKKEVKADSINGFCRVGEQMSHDHLDKLLALLRRCMLAFSVVPWLWQADIKSAFRRIPLLGEHRWAAGVFIAQCARFNLIWVGLVLLGVAYMLHGILMCAFHRSMPFGATSSVYHGIRTALKPQSHPRSEPINAKENPTQL